MNIADEWRVLVSGDVRHKKVYPWLSGKGESNRGSRSIIRARERVMVDWVSS